jgi:hypothetical protein
MTHRYRVEIRGYGGEYCLGSITKEQYEFWTDNQVMSILKGHDSAEEAFTDYIINIDEHADDDSIPAEAKFEYPWHECDEVYHLMGANVHNAWILIHEVLADQEVGILDEELSKFVENSLSEIEHHDFDWPADAEYLLESISSEKGTFFQGEFETDTPIDLNLFKIHTYESWNEEEIIGDVEYAGEDIENEGAETNGKGYFFTLHSVA